MKLLVLILHNANRHAKRDQQFYAVKDRILAKYGTVIGQDLQCLYGKACRKCAGTGGIDDWDDEYGYECDRCDGTGWYKFPKFTVLNRVKFGKYTFRQIVSSHVRKPDIQTNEITGYIEHKPAKYGALCLWLLFLLYDRRTFYDRYIKNKWPQFPKKPAIDTDDDLPF